MAAKDRRWEAHIWGGIPGWELKDRIVSADGVTVAMLDFSYCDADDIVDAHNADIDALEAENTKLRETLAMVEEQFPEREDWCYGDAYTRKLAVEECPGCEAYDALIIALHPRIEEEGNDG